MIQEKAAPIVEDHAISAAISVAPNRKLASHKCNELNELIDIEVLDQPGQGGACHSYRISHPHKSANVPSMTYIHFQNGPVKEFGVNGISIEALLSVVEDRLVGFQSGDYSCRENAIALTKVQEALLWLQKRTRDRVVRGVEGTNQK